MARGVRVTPQQREDIVLMLESMPNASDPEIAARVSGGGVSVTTVGRIRNSLRDAYDQARIDAATSNGSIRANVSPFPSRPLSEQLPRTPRTDAPEAPAVGAVPDTTGMSAADAAKAIKDAGIEAAPSLTEGTRRFIDDIAAPVAQIAVTFLNASLPPLARPAIPTPDLAAIFLAAPTRILARHTHMNVDELSPDGRDIAAMVTALAAWALEVRENYREYARAQRGTVPASRYDVATAGDRAGPESTSTRRPDSGGTSQATTGGVIGQLAAGSGSGIAGYGERNPLQDFFGRSQGQVVQAGGNAYPTRSEQPTPESVQFGRGAIGALYFADNVGRKRLGLQ